MITGIFGTMAPGGPRRPLTINWAGFLIARVNLENDCFLPVFLSQHSLKIILSREISLVPCVLRLRSFGNQSSHTSSIRNYDVKYLKGSPITAIAIGIGQ